MHERLEPRRHRFSYRVFYLAVDLDDLPRLHRTLPLFSWNRRNLVSLFGEDYLRLHEPLHNPEQTAAPTVSPPAPGGLKERVRCFCARHGADPGPGARVTLVTLPRLFGYAFNPISLFIVHRADGTAAGAIAEVTNTYREVKQYFLPVQHGPAGSIEFGAVVPKHFYVSPYSPLDAVFAFTLREPGRGLALRIDDYESGRRTFRSSLAGTARALTSASLAGALLRHPLVTLRVIALIHWQALRLWLKGVPHFPKADRPDLQRGLRHPHATLTRRSPA